MNVELFGCSGGMAEGFRRAGIHFDLVVDFDADMVASYDANIGHLPVRMDVRDLLRLVRLGWRPGTVDLLVADPPCTPWSRAGKRKGQDDARDMLDETIALIDALRPAAWMIANVPGLDDNDQWRRVVQPLIGGFAQRARYCVDYASLNAADYGVPQVRIRPFWFGHRLGTPCIRWPVPTHEDPAKRINGNLPGIDPLEPWVTCRQALGHLPPDELGKSVRLRRRPRGAHKASDPDRPGKIQTSNPNGDGCLLVHPRHPICTLDEPARTVTSRDRGGQSSSVLAVDHAHASFADKPAKTITARGSRPEQYLAWWDRPATTICADERISPLDNVSNGVKLSEKARLILQGFPEGWHVIARTKASRSSMIGQAMPPPLAEAVARSVKTQMESAVPFS